MGGVAKSRVFRSTQTSPNATTVRDLVTTFGTTPNNTTVAAFPLAGASGFRWSPNAAAAAVNPPAAPAVAVAGIGWRDTVAEDALEQITYAAGTWTMRTRLNKTVMTINASVTVRVTAIIFRVSSAGVFMEEIGRVVFADTALATVGAPVSVTGSFTGAATVFDAGDKVQVEVYVQNIVAGAPAAAVAAYTVAFVTDETNANSGSGFTAIPAFTTQFVRVPSDGSQDATTADAPVERFFKGERESIELIPTTLALDRVYKSFRDLVETVPVGADTLDRFYKGSRDNSESVPTSSTLSTAFKGERSIMESIPTSHPVPARKFTGTRAPGEETYPTTDDVPVRVYRAVRPVSETYATTHPAPERKFVGGRNNSEPIPTVDVIDRSVKQRRFLEEYPTGVTPDYTVTFPTKQITGIVRDSAGTPVAGITVKLYRDLDDRAVQTTVSAGDGRYTFLRDMFDPYTYYVGAYEEVGEKTEGITERGLAPTLI